MIFASDKRMLAMMDIESGTRLSKNRWQLNIRLARSSKFRSMNFWHWSSHRKMSSIRTDNVKKLFAALKSKKSQHWLHADEREEKTEGSHNAR